MHSTTLLYYALLPITVLSVSVLLLSAGAEMLLPLTTAQTKDSGSGCSTCDPSNAVDGVVSESNLPWQMCLHWTSVTDPWWGVDLGAHRFVTRVKLYNRNDCCPDRLQQVSIYLGHDFENLYYNPLMASGIDVPRHTPLEVPINYWGRYLFVTRPGQTGLTLCEIQVWTDFSGELHQARSLVDKWGVLFRQIWTSTHIP